MKVGAVIVAGGEGKRLGFSLPKAFVPLNGKPLYQYSLAVFQKHPKVDEIVLVIPPHRKMPSTEGIEVVSGGATRQESVFNGLSALKKSDWVLIHDAARPFITEASIDRLLEEGEKNRNAILAHPISDTVKCVESVCHSCESRNPMDPRFRGDDIAGLTHHRILKTLDRQKLWGAETPQLCPLSLLKEAFERAKKENWEVTDEASLLEKVGVAVAVVESDGWNMKITTKKDLELAHVIARSVATKQSH